MLPPPNLQHLKMANDLRHPVLHRLLGLPNEVGLTSMLLANGTNMDGCLQNTQVENLRVLTSGSLPPNPSELLGSQRMRTLLQNLKGQADVVLIDSPPTLAVTDSAVIASQVDGVVMVLQAGATRREAALRAKEEICRTGGKLIGVALNKLKASRSSGYYYYHYYYSDGKRKRRRSKRS